MLPKPNNDITRKENYSTISLMNIDVKFTTKYQQTKAGSILKGLYAHDQVGFISRMQEWFNMQKSICVIYQIDKMREENTLSFQVMQKKILTKASSIS